MLCKVCKRFYISSFCLFLTFQLGATIGSVQLDTSFEISVRERLDMANRTMPLGFQTKELDDIAWEMAKSKEYQNAKCEYGSTEDDTPYFTVAIPKLNRAYVNESAGIAYGEMKFRRSVSFWRAEYPNESRLIGNRDEIQSYFDAQVSNKSPFNNGYETNKSR